jgi:CheY-like chemotaxis protein
MEPVHQSDQDMTDALNSLLELAGTRPTAETPTAEEVLSAINKLKQKLSSGASGSSDDLVAPAAPVYRPKAQHKNILIAGQLGIILHQLRQALNKLGGEVTLAKDMESAIEQYKKQEYSLVIIDLYMPTEREGMIVLEEINRTNMLMQANSQIVVLAPVSKDNNLQDVCRTKGAAFFLEKVDGWHNTILSIYMGESPPKPNNQ